MIRNLGLPVSSGELILAVLAVVLGAVGTYQMLPHRHGWAKPWRAYAVGGGLVGLSVLLMALFWSPPAPWLRDPTTNLFFYAFGLAAVGCGFMMVTSRNPIYSALWFAAVVLSTSGLFLMAGAQFLAAGTVIVYAGAIIVTFLFVIMLAQMEGHAPYDRSARSPARATLTCFLLLFGLLYALLAAKPAPEATPRGVAPDRAQGRSERLLASQEGRAVLDRAVSPTLRWPEGRDPEAPRYPHPARYPHVAGLGGTLYTDYLLIVELAGALLFVALIGAIAIATPRLPVRPGVPAPGEGRAT